MEVSQRIMWNFSLDMTELQLFCISIRHFLLVVVSSIKEPEWKDYMCSMKDGGQ